ncbi:retrotransposon hot spot (RHS) protein [Trypanosoma conorhini]|uniref:Retrotransposon hot spot (RHS) protein n=1 Tax=Trypanosoma conorhini TaxID=83891 RepID=A0A422MXP6_9TRYP|nr:retrotransposon hot spot (RHS) protein [Trypanosoma conorhini]RNE97986.1 retrotransposon hot spot (RHS) protein [Trypanosoma conorhini]
MDPRQPRAGGAGGGGWPGQRNEAERLLREHVGRAKCVDEGRNVSMEVFARGPRRYVKDKQLLGEIANAPRYRRFLFARKLAEKGVVTLRDWREVGVGLPAPRFRTETTRRGPGGGGGGSGKEGSRRKGKAGGGKDKPNATGRPLRLCA